MSDQPLYTNVVVGGSGFIGSSLIQALREKNETVASISRDVGDFIAGVDVFPLDVKEIKVFQELFPRGENVFILIGQTSSSFDALQELTNLENVIHAVNASSPKRVMYLSSALVYGESDSPAAESDALSPNDEYSRFKADAEKLLQTLLHPDILLGIIRLANVYGNPKNKGFIDILIRHALDPNSEILSVYGDGTQERDYMYIDDVAQALIAVRDGLLQWDIVNIATSYSPSVNELIDHVSRILHRPVLKETKNVIHTEVHKSHISNAKLRDRYQFTPSFSIVTGLQKTLLRYSAKKEEAPRRVLLLGGEGFIGRNLVAELSQDHNCFSGGKEKSIWQGREDVFVHIDPYTHMPPGRYDTIIHLIDHAIALSGFAEAEQRLVDAMRLQPQTHLIVISSSVLYTQPDSAYANRKQLLEDVYTVFCTQNHIPLTIVRLFNVYGPFQYPYRPGSLVANLFVGYLHQKLVQVRDMDAERDFIYAPDAARIIGDIIRRRILGTFDVGTTKLTSLTTLIDILERDILDDRLLVESMKDREVFSCPPAKNHIELTAAPTSLTDGLRHTYEFYKQYKELFHA